MQTIGVLFHPKVPRTLDVAQEIRTGLAAHGVNTWIASAWDEDEVKRLLPPTEILITLGGDGTILRAARMSLEHGIPIAGVNFGRLGFLAEYQPDQILQCLTDLVEGNFWLEDRRMLRAELGFSVASAEAEVRRYCATPTYQLCYAVGRRDILALREDARAQRGKNFSLADFHAELLGYGALPAVLARWGMGLA